MVQPIRPASGFRPNPVDPDVLWRAYCYDSSKPEFVKVFDNRNHSPSDVTDRVILILQIKGFMSDVDRVTGSNKYVIDHEGRWKGADARDIQDEIDLGTPYDLIRRGYWANSERYEWIIYQSMLDPAFPQRDIQIEDVLRETMLDLD